MAGNKTHEQQLRILEKHENTRNADKDFNAKGDLKKSGREREAYRKGADLKPDMPDIADRDDRNIIRGENQESGHHKRRADD
ncbi:hypothetical protein NKH55_13630 [Mesorhizobium opportunistum]|uniref:hypothetical protein n=1 Tax=Mesorhizobium opportunistum TaxID=593909 RepID=UPI0033375A63